MTLRTFILSAALLAPLSTSALEINLNGVPLGGLEDFAEDIVSGVIVVNPSGMYSSTSVSVSGEGSASATSRTILRGGNGSTSVRVDVRKEHDGEARTSVMERTQAEQTHVRITSSSERGDMKAEAEIAAHTPEQSRARTVLQNLLARFKTLFQFW